MTRAAVERAADVIRARWPKRPEVAVILGTGLGGLGSEIAVEEGATMLRLGTVLFGERQP